MKCKYCKRDLPENALFCCWCGKRQINAVKEIKIPAPKQLDSGTWFGRIMVDGKRVSISADNEKEYYAKATATKAGLIEIKKTPSKQNLDDVIKGYLEDNESVLSPSTLRGYYTNKKQIEAYSVKPVSDINFQQMISKLSDKYASKTVKNIWGLITAACKYGKIELPSVNLPAVQTAERNWLDYEQITTFLTAIEGEPCELGALLALHSLRRSEIYALAPENIRNNQIIVRGAAVYNQNNKRVRKKTNKTEESTRTIPVMIPRLTELTDGLPFDQNLNTLWRQINKVCEKNNLPLVGVHGLRHSFASLAYHLKWDVKTTMLVGGWATPDIPQKIYTHLAQQDVNSDVKRMQEFYGNDN